MKYLTGIFATFEFLLIYSVSSTVSNFLVNTMGRIGLYIVILMACYDYYKKQLKNIILPDKLFNLCYWPFFLLIILSSFLIGYDDSLHFAYNYSRYAIVTFLVFYFLFQKQFYEHVIIAGISGGTGTLCWFALQQFFSSPLGTRISGSFDQPNFTCILLNLSVPFLIIYFVNKNRNIVWRIVSLFFSLLTVFVIASTGSRGGILGLIIGGFILLFIQTVYVKKISLRKLLLNYLAVSITAFCIGIIYWGIFYGNFNTQQVENQQNTHIDTQQQVTTQPKLRIVRSYDNQRMLFWKSSYHMWEDHKLLGIGLMHWQQEYYGHYILPEAREKNIGFPHNIFVSYFSMTGMIGGVGLLFFTFGMFLYLCWKLKQHPNNIFLNAFIWSFLTIMIHGLVDSGIMEHYPIILYNAYLGIGLASITYYERMDKR